MARVSRLPRIVSLKPGAQFFDATDRIAVSALARRLAALTEEERRPVAAAMLSQGVMRWLRAGGAMVHAVVWVRSRRGGHMRRYELWRALIERQPQIAGEIVLAAADHAIRGKDAEDPRSYGGFSQREINFIANLIGAARGSVG